MKNQQSDPTESQTSAEHRSNVSQTRGRMDDTINELASRLEGRHIVDELLGYFRSRRSSNGNGSAHQVKERAVESAGAVTHAVVDTVRRHPLPSALIGTGIAWMIYERYRPEDTGYDDLSLTDEELSGQEMYFEHGQEWGESQGSGGSRMQRARRKIGEGKHAVERRSSHLAQRVKGGVSAVRERIGGESSPVGERTRAGVTAARRGARRAGYRVRHTASSASHRGREQIDEHPLEAGIIALAGGLLAGLLTPNPRKVDEWVGPTARDLRDQASDQVHEYVERGKEVASAAVETAKEEAREQGLTPDALKEKAKTVADETKRAATETARHESEPKREDTSLAGESENLEDSAGHP